MEIKNQSFIKTRAKNWLLHLVCPNLWGHYIAMALVYLAIGYLFFRSILYCCDSIGLPIHWFIRYILFMIGVIIAILKYVGAIQNKANAVPQFVARRILILGANAGIYFTNGIFIGLGMLLQLDRTFFIDLHAKTIDILLDNDTMLDKGGLALFGFKLNILRNVEPSRLDHYVKGKDDGKDVESMFEEVIRSRFISKANAYTARYHFEKENNENDVPGSLNELRDEEKIKTFLLEGIEEFLKQAKVPFTLTITGVEFPTPVSPELRAAMEAKEIAALVREASKIKHLTKGEQLASIKAAAKQGIKITNPDGTETTFSVELSDQQVLEIWKLDNGGQDINTHGAPILGVGNLSGSGTRTQTTN